jgi:hypothetical protein
MPAALHDPVQLVVYTLALASITRLVTGTDKLTEIPMGWVFERLDDSRAWIYTTLDDTPWSSGWVVSRIVGFPIWFTRSMLSCVWCAPFWLALGVILPVMVHHASNAAVYYVALGLAMRFVAGLLNDR